MVVKWNLNAFKTFEKAIIYIKQDSIINAENVRIRINTEIDTIVNNPLKHPIDKYKKINDGSYRAFEIYHYRIAYKISNAQIIILRFRSTHQEPKTY